MELGCVRGFGGRSHAHAEDIRLPALMVRTDTWVLLLQPDLPHWPQSWSVSLALSPHLLTHPPGPGRTGRWTPLPGPTPA